MRIAILRLICFCCLITSSAVAQSKIEVALPDAPPATAFSGRLVVYLLPGKAKSQPADGVFYSKARPMFGINISQLKAATVVVLDDSADSYPDKISRLPAGQYTAQAVLVTHRTCSDWRADEGNWFSQPMAMEIASTAPVRMPTTAPAVFHLKLDQQTHAPVIDPLPQGLELFSIRSKLLSDFAGHDVRLNATVMMPTHLQTGRKYPALYHVPGYGGRHWDGIAVARKRLQHPTTEPTQVELNDNLFEIFLDPETPTGHCLFCDSDVNGPWGSALTKELIPALEKKYPLIADPMARLLRGHSSGGWSTLWLATEYPQVFGATWSTSPDPVSFHRFETSDLYQQTNFYRKPAETGQEILLPSFRKNGIILHIEEENRMEQIIGPRNTSGEQWASWLSCWGHRGTDGSAISPWDPLTGKIDHHQAETFRRFDILDRLEKQPDHFGPLFKQRVRLVVGGEDNFYLNEAVELLKTKLDAMNFTSLPEGQHGYVTVVPGLGHSTLFGSRELADFPAQMLAHLKLHNCLTAPSTQPSKAESGPIDVREIHWQTPAGPVHGYQATINLDDPRLTLHVTHAMPHPQNAAPEVNATLTSVDRWATDNHLTLAINANYFGWKKGGGQILGLVVDDGKVVSPQRQWHNKPDPALVFLQDKSGWLAKLIGPDQPPVNPDEIRFAVAGVGGSDTDPNHGTLLVQAGKNLGSTARVFPESHLARTAIGVDHTGHQLTIITIDGRQPDWSVGLTLPELAQKLIDAGVTDALNLDGGGSTSFVYHPDENAPEITNRPCDESAAGRPGIFRPVAVQLGFAVK
jgi:hypothetical protein